MRIEGAVVKVGMRSLRLRPQGEDEDLTLRVEAGSVEDPFPVPGEIVEAEVQKRWRYRNNPYATGRVLGIRLDASRLALLPLALHRRGDWSLREDTDQGVFFSPRVRRLAPGPAPDWELEQVIPGYDPDGHPGEDPAIRAAALADQGRIEEGLDILARAVAQDLRYLDGHAHLASVALRRGRSGPTLARALRHYAAGIAIGETFLPAPFDGYLRGAWMDNRPFLRCVHGLGLCQGAAGDHAAAHATFERLLRLDPQDHGGAEALLEDLERGSTDAWLTR